MSGVEVEEDPGGGLTRRSESKSRAGKNAGFFFYKKFLREIFKTFSYLHIKEKMKLTRRQIKIRS